MRVPFNVAFFSGKIQRIFPKNPDKYGNFKISITLALVSAGKKGKQSYMNLTCYDLEIENAEWFKVDNYIYTQCTIPYEGFYLVDNISPSPLDCYGKFMDRVYHEERIYNLNNNVLVEDTIDDNL